MRNVNWRQEVWVPITLNPKEDKYSFRRVTVEIVGPIDLVSAADHKYCLCIVDSCSRCLAFFLYLNHWLGKIFLTISVQGTNYTCSRFDKRIFQCNGCSRKFRMLVYSKTARFWERWNQSFASFFRLPHFYVCLVLYIFIAHNFLKFDILPHCLYSNSWLK